MLERNVNFGCGFIEYNLFLHQKYYKEGKIYLLIEIKNGEPFIFCFNGISIWFKHADSEEVGWCSSTWLHEYLNSKQPTVEHLGRLCYQGKYGFLCCVLWSRSNLEIRNFIPQFKYIMEEHYLDDVHFWDKKIHMLVSSSSLARRKLYFVELYRKCCSSRDKIP